MNGWTRSASHPPPLPPQEAAALEATAVRLAQAAGAQITAAVNGELTVQFKETRPEWAANSNPVSQVDQSVERFIRARAGTAHPQHAIIGEEQAPSGPPGALDQLGHRSGGWNLQFHQWGAAVCLFNRCAARGLAGGRCDLVRRDPRGRTRCLPRACRGPAVLQRPPHHAAQARQLARPGRRARPHLPLRRALGHPGTGHLGCGVRLGGLRTVAAGAYAAAATVGRGGGPGAVACRGLQRLTWEHGRWVPLLRFTPPAGKHGAGQPGRVAAAGLIGAAEDVAAALKDRATRPERRSRSRAS